MSNLPFIVSGVVTDSTAATPEGVRVTVRNDRTVEVLHATTDANGQYIVDLANLTSGYQSGDSITAIVGYGIESGESTSTITGGSLTLHVTLTITTTSAEISYCTVTDVWDALDEKTASDISAEDVKNIIRQAEAELDLMTNRTFTARTITDEIYSWNHDNTFISREARSYGTVTNALQRSDQMFTGGNTIYLAQQPVSSVTSISRNFASLTEADNWQSVSVNSGSGGDVIFHRPTGALQFLRNTPPMGHPRAMKVTYVAGIASDTTDPTLQRILQVVKKATVYLAVNMILKRKLDAARFDDPDDIEVDVISTRAQTTAMRQYITANTQEVQRLVVYLKQQDTVFANTGAN